MIKRIIPVLLLCVFACTSKEPFNKVLWNTYDGMFWPYRESMLDDLTKNHKLVGLRYSEVIKLLGGSNYTEEDVSLTYNVVTDYGSDIDPIYIKTLELKFNKDSVLTSFKVKKWSKP